MPYNSSRDLTSALDLGQQPLFRSVRSLHDQTSNYPRNGIPQAINPVLTDVLFTRRAVVLGTVANLRVQCCFVSVQYIKPNIMRFVSRGYSWVFTWSCIIQIVIKCERMCIVTCGACCTLYVVWCGYHAVCRVTRIVCCVLYCMSCISCK